MRNRQDVEAWLDTGDYLPEHIRDFHDQKNLFKSMHLLYEKNKNNYPLDKPNWIDGHVYVVDWFLWYMAGRGYTLQKSRANVDFYEFENHRDLMEKLED